MPSEIGRALARARDMASTADQRTRAAVEELAAAMSQLAVRAGVETPETIAPAGGIEETSYLLPPPAAVAARTHPTSVEVWWTPVPNAATYSVRSAPGSEGAWEGSRFEARTAALTVRLDPRDAGPWTFLVASHDLDGRRSERVTAVTLAVRAPEAPELSAKVLLNNVLLRWNTPDSSFSVDRYELFRQAPGEQAPVSQGRVFGTFQPFFEAAGGTYLYFVTAFDIADNEGPRTALEVEVHNPPDYVLEDEFEIDLSSAAGHAGCAWDAYAKTLSLAVDPRSVQAKLAAYGNTKLSQRADAGYPKPLQPAQEGTCLLEERTLPAELPNAIFHFEGSFEWSGAPGTLHPRWQARGYDLFETPPSADNAVRFAVTGIRPRVIGAAKPAADAVAGSNRWGIWLAYHGYISDVRLESQAILGTGDDPVTFRRFGIFAANAQPGFANMTRLGLFSQSKLSGISDYDFTPEQVENLKIVMRDSADPANTFLIDLPEASVDAENPYVWDDGTGFRDFLEGARDGGRTVDLAVVDKRYSGELTAARIRGDWPDAWVEGVNVSLENVRAVRVGMRAVPPDDKSFVTISMCSVRADVLLGVDSGTATVDADDAEGTEVPYSTRPDGLTHFLAVRSVVATPVSSTEVHAVEFFDKTESEPTTFRLKLFDTAGTQVSGVVSWIAHGIVR